MKIEQAKRAAIPITSAPENGPPYQGQVMANPVVDPDDVYVRGRIIATCKHNHREIFTAFACAERLWRRRCPRLARLATT